MCDYGGGNDFGCGSCAELGHGPCGEVGRNYYPPPSPMGFHCDDVVNRDIDCAASELENSTIHKQRRELGLLIEELQDRDRELNVLLETHQKQSAAFEATQQKLMNVENRCAQQEDDLEVMSQRLGSLTQECMTLEKENTHLQNCLDEANHKIKDISKSNDNLRKTLDDTENKNASLCLSLKDSSIAIGTLQGKEQEHITHLRLKDQELIQKTTEISELEAKNKKAEIQLKESRAAENDLHKKCCEWKSKHCDGARDYQKLSTDYTSLLEAHKEVCLAFDKCKDQLQTSCRDYEMSLEREKRKDQLLELQRSKQERAESELHNLKGTFEQTQKELSMLQVNLQSAREVLADESRRRDYRLVTSAYPQCTCDGISAECTCEDGDCGAGTSLFPGQENCNDHCSLGYRPCADDEERRLAWLRRGRADSTDPAVVRLERRVRAEAAAERLGPTARGGHGVRDRDVTTPKRLQRPSPRNSTLRQAPPPITQTPRQHQDRTAPQTSHADTISSAPQYTGHLASQYHEPPSAPLTNRVRASQQSHVASPPHQGHAAPPLLQSHTAPPPQGHTVPPPHHSHAASPPHHGQAASPPHKGHVASPPHQGQVASPPHQGYAASPPHQGHAASPPYQGHAASPPHQGHAASPPYQGHAASPPHQGHAALPPYQGHAASPPYQGHAASPPQHRASYNLSVPQDQPNPSLASPPQEQHTSPRHSQEAAEATSPPHLSAQIEPQEPVRLSQRSEKQNSPHGSLDQEPTREVKDEFQIPEEPPDHEERATNWNYPRRQSGKTKPSQRSREMIPLTPFPRHHWRRGEDFRRRKI